MQSVTVARCQTLLWRQDQGGLANYCSLFYDTHYIMFLPLVQVIHLGVHWSLDSVVVILARWRLSLSARRAGAAALRSRKEGVR